MAQYRSHVLAVLAEHIPDCTLEEFFDVARVVHFLADTPIKGGLPGRCQTLGELQERSVLFERLAREVGLFEPIEDGGKK